ncbi:putative ferric-chelate reductase 1 [Oryzias melastigma]|uniref:Putative ferric-chelate reductase 1 n=1 Tax=Oryzias melastigma TaxID=30732 RepID=A0A834CJN5_ORYME|nr:putative ferric-chelate reductase 1 [Oryzias melastigma]KAF6728115.1 putative ferric-chelate reductase 1 [Oryzias melastigma]
MESAFILMISTLILVVAPDVKAEFPINKTNCGVTKYCISEPADCDPEGNSTCLFGSLRLLSQTPPNGINLHNELSGNSSGYIALGLTPASGGNTTLYICAKNNSNNGSIFFTVMSLNSANSTSPPTLLNMTMPMFSGNVTSDKIQCVFNISNLNATATTRSTPDTMFSIKLGTGSVDSNGNIGPFTASKSTGPLDLANLLNSTVNATTAPTTTMSAATSVMPYHAALILLSILGVFVLGMA